MGWYGVSCDGDVTRAGCGDRFCLEGSECDTAMWCCAMRARVMRWAVSGVEENAYKRGLASAYKWLQVVTSIEKGVFSPCRICFLFMCVSAFRSCAC